ncbi:unnamed protein product [Microthlaspi erraticum]|uniref:Uncharacterized protein n=1 Tax=Microthlaspi erraticum TaxID=1685480 RepID=A0A6D2ID32_9BRAS|nr:unnamed protein product [Microthlaspi erraticum]
MSWALKHTFTTAQVSRKLKQLGLPLPRGKKSKADMMLKDDLDDSSQDDSDNETLSAFKKRKSRKSQKIEKHTTSSNEITPEGSLDKTERNETSPHFPTNGKDEDADQNHITGQSKESQTDGLSDNAPSTSSPDQDPNLLSDHELEDDELADSGEDVAPVSASFTQSPLSRLEGFSTITSGVGIPVHSEFPKLNAYSNGITKLKVVIDLYKKRHPTVRITDKLGTSILISASYPNLPPKCSLCKEFGHLQLRCPESITIPSSPMEIIPPPILPQIQTSPVSPVCRVSAQSQTNLVNEHHHSRSLPSSPLPSNEASNSIASDRVIRRPKSISPSHSSLSRKKRGNPVTQSQFEEEEEIIKTAQVNLRNRFSSLEKAKVDPPYQKFVGRKSDRRKQRQKLLSLSTSNPCTESTSQHPEQTSINQVVFGSFDQVPEGPARVQLE